MENEDEELFEIPETHALSPECVASPRMTVVEDYVFRGDIIELVAKTKVGKTHLAMQVGYALSQGLPIFGFETVKQKVLYVDLHNSRGEFSVFCEIGDRFRRERGLPAESLKGNYYYVAIETYKLGNVKHLVDTLLQYKKDEFTFIIIDPIYRLLDEDKFTDWVNAFHELHRLSRGFDKATVLFVHFVPDDFIGGCPRVDKNVAGDGIQESACTTLAVMGDLELTDEFIKNNKLADHAQGFQLNFLSKHREPKPFRVIYENEYFRREDRILNECKFVGEDQRFRDDDWEG